MIILLNWKLTFCPIDKEKSNDYKEGTFVT